MIQRRHWSDLARSCIVVSRMGCIALVRSERRVRGCPPMVATRLRVSMVRWLEESGFMQKKCWRQNGTPKYGDVTGSIQANQ